ncbi:MAG: hypothetical protein JST92_17220 [Deltaproteobacteria bacterium]|nr:hypothetical protein [Deltaproteobacteria bacterium]
MSERDDSSWPLAKRLGLRDDTRALLLEPPVGFERKLQPLPPGATVATRPFGQADVIVLFASSRAVLMELFHKATQAMAPRAHIFACWPRKSSGMFTDLTEEQVRAVGLSNGLTDDKFLSLDETWASLRFVFKERPRRNLPRTSEVQIPDA